MSYTGYTPQYTHEDWDAQYAKKQKLSSKVAWWHPKENAIYLSDNDKSPNYPEGMKVIPDVAKVTEAIELENQGKMSTDKATFSIFNKQDGWEDMANEYYSDRYLKRTAGVMAPQDFTGIEVTNVLSTLLGLPERNFVLQNAVLTIPTPYLDVRVDTWTGADVAEDIKIGAEIPTLQGSFSATTYTLKLNAAHIAKYDETDYRPHYWDIWRTNLENIARRMVKKKAQLIGTELQSATTSAGALWDAYTTDHSTTNPFQNIGTVADIIVGNDGNPNTIAMHDKVYRNMIGNTFVHGYANPSSSANIPDQPGMAKTVTIPGFQYQIFVDNVLTPSTTAIVYDKQAIVGFQGPISTSSYRDALHRFDGFISTDYFLTKITQTGKIRVITGVAT